MNPFFARFSGSAGLMNAFWLLVESTLRLLTGVVVAGAVGRYLAPEGYGLLNYAIAVFGIISALGKLGLEVVLLRELSIARTLAERQKLVFSSVSLRMVTSAVFYLLYALMIVSIRPADPSFYLILVISIGLLFQPLDVIETLFQANSRSKQVVKLKLTQLVLGAAFRLYLIHIGADLMWFAFAVVLDQILLTAIYLFLLLKEGLGLRWHWDRALAGQLLKESLPLVASSVFVFIYMRIDQVMIRNLLGDHEVGLFAVATKFAEVWYFIPVAAVNSFTPAIVRAFSEGRTAEFEKLTVALLRYMNWAAIAFGIAITLAAGWLVEIVFGPGFQGAETLLRIYVWTGIFVAMSYAHTPWIMANKLQTTFLQRSIVGAVLNILLNVPFILWWGAPGACMATLVAHAMATMVFDFFNSSTRRLFMLKLESIFFVRAGEALKR